MDIESTAHPRPPDKVVIIGAHAAGIEKMVMIQNLVDTIGSVEHHILDHGAEPRPILPRLILVKNKIHHIMAENILTPFHKWPQTTTNHLLQTLQRRDQLSKLKTIYRFSTKASRWNRLVTIG